MARRLALAALALLITGSNSRGPYRHRNRHGIFAWFQPSFQRPRSYPRHGGGWSFCRHLGGRALWLVPLSFVAMMVVGGVLGVGGIGLPLVEIGIAASVIVLGLAVALQWNLPVAGGWLLVGFFALFHGQAHGAEMPVDASGLAYGVGFVFATAILHLIGIELGLGIGLLAKATSRRTMQAGGAVMSLAGAAMLTGFL